MSETIDIPGTTDPTEVATDTSARRVPRNYRQHQVLKVLLFALAVTFMPRIVSSGYAYDLLDRWLIMSVVTVGFYIAFGLGGQFAFSQASFMAVGAYVSAKVSTTHEVWLGFVAAIIVCCALGALFALAMRKANQFFFAIATLAVGELILIVATRWTEFAGPSGQVVGIARLEIFGKVFRTQTEVMYLLLAVLVIGLLIAAFLERSPVRREAIVNRDNALVALTLGVPTLRLRVEMFTLGTAYAGAAGSLFAHTNGFITPEAFGVDVGVQIFLMAIIGGLGSYWGAVAGAAFVIYVGEALRDFSQYKGLVYGGGLILVMTVMPHGLVQGVIDYARRGWRKARGRLAREGAA